MDTFCTEYNNPELWDQDKDDWSEEAKSVDPLAYGDDDPDYVADIDFSILDVCEECEYALDESGYCDFCEA